MFHFDPPIRGGTLAYLGERKTGDVPLLIDFSVRAVNLGPRGLGKKVEKMKNNVIGNKKPLDIDVKNQKEEEVKNVKVEAGNVERPDIKSTLFENPNSPAPKKRKVLARRWKILIGVAVATILIGGIAYAAFPTVSNSVADFTAPKTETGQVTWAMAPGDYSNDRWFAEGIEEIKNATNDEEAKKATYTFLEKCKTDANRMVGLATIFLGESIDKATLIDASGNATDATLQLYTRLYTALATAHITLANAPANGTNSGIDASGNVVQSATSGIEGDLKAVQVNLANGKVVWVMARCGNPVVMGNVGLPTGKTDNPPPSPNPPNPPTDDQKVGSQDPAPQGNAPEGGGTNQDPSAGQYVPQNEMPVVPTTPYVAPEVPVVETPPVYSEPDPVVAPPPEKEPTTPEEPATGVVPVPGIS